LLLGAGKQCLRRAWGVGRPAARMHVTAPRPGGPRGFQPGPFDPAGARGPALGPGQRGGNQAPGGVRPPRRGTPPPARAWAGLACRWPAWNGTRPNPSTSATFTASCASEGGAMFGGVALALSELPEALVERHGLRGRVHDRGGEPEVRFLYRKSERVLPVWLDGELQICRWGNRRGESRRLPCTAW